MAGGRRFVMNAENKMIVWIVALVCFSFLSTVAIILYTDHSNKKIFVENGYEQVMLLGEEVSKWQKAK